MNRLRTQKTYSFIMCFFIILNLVSGIIPVYATEDIIFLNGPDESENKLFTVENMFPGDVISKKYILNISHKKSIDVMFKAKVMEGSDPLFEVLKLKITIDGVTEPLWDGLMKETPEPVTFNLPADQKSLTYCLTVYLDKNVGNKSDKDPDGKRYQNESLKADFEWYYMPESTGGSTNTNKSTTKLLRRAYVIGRPGASFEPESPITRAEIATIFARIFADYDERNLVSTDTKFKDIEKTDWFAKYISRCEKENIIFGFDGNFNPDDSITRAELATICVRFFEKRSGSTITPEDIFFTDFDSSHWAYNAIMKAYANGYISGYPDGTLKADDTITRSEAVALVNRILDRIPDKSYIDKNLYKLIEFNDVKDNTYWAYYEIFEAANTHYIRFINGFAKWVD